MVSLTEAEKEFITKLGRRIAEIREGKNISQLRLADLSDIERSNIIRIEKGRTNPTSTTLLKISTALEVTLAELMTF